MNNIILVNYPFTKNDNKCFFIEDELQRFRYFEGLKDSIKIKNINFLINDGINSKVQHIKFDTNKFYELSKYNYAVIFKTDEKTGGLILESVRYYFATIRQEGGSLYSYDLEIDDVMTNYFRNRNKIYGLVNRAHLNRFKLYSGDNYVYDFSLRNSFISQSNRYNTNKIIKKQFKLYHQQEVHNEPVDIPDGAVDTFKTWLSKHVKFWVVVLLSNNKYKGILNIESQSIPLYYGNSGGLIKTPYSVCYFPIMEEHYHLCGLTEGGSKFFINYESFEDFLETEGNSPNIYNILYVKDLIFSDDFTFDRYEDINNEHYAYLRSSRESQTSIAFLTDENGNIKIAPNIFITKLVDSNNFIYRGLLWGGIINNKYIYENKDLNEYVKSNIIYNKDVIKDFSNDISPLLVTSNCLSLNLNSDGGNGYEYDLSLMLTGDDYKDLKFEVNFGLDVSGVDSFIRLGKEYGLYGKYYVNSQVGLTESTTLSMPWANDKFSEYVANNKNYRYYWRRENFKEAFKGFSNVITSPSPGQSLSNSLNTIYNITDLNLYKTKQFEDMSASPDSINANSSSFYLKLMKDRHGYYIDVYEVNEYEKQLILNDVIVNGYVVNKLGYAYNYDNIRSYYNYLSMNIDEIDDENMSNAEKERLINKLKGFTFIDTSANLKALYNNKNFERYLKDE